ncbi:MAG: amidohydrolase family protein [Planctomycetes bacterium]|nr:amidohydrolase family protein [Planctomycetota bacterium]
MRMASVLADCNRELVWSSAIRLETPLVVAEELMIARDLLLLEQTEARYHVQHVSTAKAAMMIRQAKQQGLKVTAEVTPHHLLLTQENCRGYDTNYKVNPPLRTSEDVTALREAVADGTIDCLVTDHAPHLGSEKELEFPSAPPGMVGLDCAVGLYAKALVETDTIGWPRLIEMMTIGAARILQINKGSLSVGADADITVIDPAARWQVNVEQFYSKSRNCPYDGWDLTGRAVCTIVAGKIRFELKDEG